MGMQRIDWVIIAGFFVVLIAIGLAAARKAGKSSADFFLGGRSMPWWLLGVSMVACTFSCDTPNLVTGMVRGGGVVANWGWWAFLITGMVTVFIYAQLWRRSRVMTDLEFYELRYSGKSAAFIRGFRAIYLGVFFNVLIMGTVTLAAIKIGQVIFDLEGWQAVVLGSIGVVIYATAGGIVSCIWTDFFQYGVAFCGAVYAAFIACRQPEVGGLANLLTNPMVAENLSWMPDFSTWLAWVPLLLIPVAVQWWAAWYPGAEPGGGGYIAQRMLAAKDEKNAIGATLFFNFMHYAMRPWPWIIVALASMIIYPTLDSIKTQFPGIDPTYLAHDIAYPAMISRLGPGGLGLVVASLIAAYMSTIGTHLNWGSSYAVNDFYKRFINPRASEKQLILVGRICTVLLMTIAGILGLKLKSANQGFEILILSGAGTGTIYLLRWFWWRINAWTEIVSMVVATIVACWIVLGVGEQGTVAWYVGSDAVSDRVMVIDDLATVESIQAQKDQLTTGINSLEEEVATLAEKWRDAKKEGQAARDGARAVYEAKFNELSAARNRASVAVLAAAMQDKPWYGKLQEFQAEQNKWQLDRTNSRLQKLNLESKKAEDVNVSLDGLIANDKVYIYHPEITSLKFAVRLLVCIAIVTAAWLAATLLTPAVDKKTLRNFYKLCHPGGPGWRKVVLEARSEGIEIDQKNAIGDWKLPIQILCVFLGCVSIYAALFSVGNFVYGNMTWGFVLLGVVVVSTVALFNSFNKIGVESEEARTENSRTMAKTN